MQLRYLLNLSMYTIEKRKEAMVNTGLLKALIVMGLNAK